MINVFRHFEVGPGVSITEDIYTVRKRRVLKTCRIEIIVGSDPTYNLLISIWNADHKVLPGVDYFRGNNSKIIVIAPYVWHSGETITIKATNTHATEIRYFQINIDAEEKLS